MYLSAILITGILLAYANGANDNFKGVATLFGSGTTNRKHALIWATLTTLLGSLCAIWLAGELLERFSGRGIISDTLTANPVFTTAIAIGAGLTVLLATRLGMPVSTTHALVGALNRCGARVRRSHCLADTIEQVLRPAAAQSRHCGRRHNSTVSDIPVASRRVRFNESQLFLCRCRDR
jgi:phosphate/sulfate permease